MSESPPSRPHIGEPVPGSSEPASDDPEPPASLALSVELQTDEVDPPLTGWLDEQLRRVAAAAGLAAGELRLRIVDDAAMSELHRRYKGVAGPTDVLTFDLREDIGDPVDADMVIGLDEAQRQAAQRGHAARVEVLLYATHGLLHLLGEDDGDPAAFERMHRREDELLAAVGVGPVFSRGGETT